MTSADSQKPVSGKKTSIGDGNSNSSDKPIATTNTSHPTTKTIPDKPTTKTSPPTTKSVTSSTDKPVTGVTAPPTPPPKKPAATTTTATRVVAKRPPLPRRSIAKRVVAPPAPPPEFEKSISEKIIAKFGEKTKSTFIKKHRIGISTAKEDVHEIAQFIRDDLNYDHVESVSGVDYYKEKAIEVVYHIGSYTDDTLSDQIIALSTRAPREDDPMPGSDATRLPSLRDVFYSVEFHEREIFEMFGVYFEGHPDNRRLLLPEDWADIPPLRKDFAIKGR